ncbi:LolA family protein [Galbitalea soli]|uniref:DUF2092 domain-containing protein n=1 Tax=Galbitalea soli TaxID=1268042 RepID=A0A7C9PNH5_9MICO|nr:sigma-E factor regulatory protein RseB domain-containing protein [Galbitalea soli]NEM91409.1 DUF2092 domain-containing protein [Galbitalea soli]NYJ30102.1 outer membrane lipoprotein-sorting protein [Galbitalea soli]
MKTWQKWMPAAVIPVVIAGIAIAVPMSADAAVHLPAKTPAQVLELMASSSVTAFSGTISQTSDLGLPSLPTTGLGSGSSLAGTLALLTGTHTVRVYVSGASRVRVQQLDQLAERDVVRNGTDVWVYSSAGNTVTHATVPSRDRHRAVPLPATLPTPAEAADRIVAALQKSSTLRVGTSERVAGRAAYELILTPTATDTLVGSASIAVDAATGLPLRVDVTARAQTAPAVSLGFTSISLARPAASLFAFTPPAGATVTEQTAPRQHAAPAPSKPATTPPARTVTGTGWDAVVTIAADARTRTLTSSKQFTALTSVVPGGRLFHTSIVNVLFTADGRVVAGSVPESTLAAVAAARSK